MPRRSKSWAKPDSLDAARRAARVRPPTASRPEPVLACGMRIEAQHLIKRAVRDLENARKNVGIGAFEAAAEEFGIVRTATLEGSELLTVPRGA